MLQVSILACLLAKVVLVNCKVYNVTSQCLSDSTESHSGCLTLSQLAENTSGYTSSDVTFVLQHGTHILDIQLSISNAGNVFINGSDIHCRIECINDGQLSFNHVNDVKISNVYFVNCKSHLVTSVDKITIKDSTFRRHDETAINFFNSSASIINASFTSNFNHIKDDGVGGAIIVRASNVTIMDSNFEDNSAEKGGVIHASLTSNVTIMDSIFSHNEAELGGVVFAHNSNISIKSSMFRSNIATYIGAVLHLNAKTNLTANDLVLENNTAEEGVMYLVESTCTFTGNTQVSYNVGSLLLYHSNGFFNDNTTFYMNTENSTSFHEGGAVTVTRSQITFRGRTRLVHNKGENGGAIHAIASRVELHGYIDISHNNATEAGGGVYLFISELVCDRDCVLNIMGNAATVGGGTHIITSILTAVHGSKINFVQNTASTNGGGANLEVNAKINILRVQESSRDNIKNEYRAITFSENSANCYGGAMYVKDETYFGTCNATKQFSTTTECFLQVIILDDMVDSDTAASLYDGIVFFDKNRACEGAVLYGGLLDRCTPSPYTRISEGVEGGSTSGLLYFNSLSNMSDLDSVSSEAVRVCLCNNNELICNHHLSPITVMRGETFTVTLATIDQANHMVGAKIHAFISEQTSGNVNPREVKTDTNCKNFNFRVESQLDTVDLLFYADGPCHDATLSLSKIAINFTTCVCPIGFQEEHNVIACTCECDTKLTDHVDLAECNQQNKALVRRTNSWINYTNISDRTTGYYLIHLHCPLNHCTSSASSVYINLNTPDGGDVQCAPHRTGVLCGSCKPGFSLSLGSSRCIACPRHWPAIFIGILMLFFVAGIALVALLMWLNLTVAVGTLNGIIFYANIIEANSGSIFRFSTQNFTTVFISWLNFDFGFDVCFVKNLDAYWKTWLQMAFPTYVIFLALMVIFISHRSKRFSQLIGDKHPVATLATLIFLSYAKYLKVVLSILTCTTMIHSGPSNESETYNTHPVWRLDGTITCYKGKHTALFIVATFILLAGTVYTILLLTWQWLLKLHNKFCSARALFCCLRMSMFIEAYHTPYTPQSRYWTGLMLLARVVLYIASTANVSNNPKIDLLITGVVMINPRRMRERGLQ